MSDLSEKIFLKKFGKHVSKLRKQRGISRVQLAFELGTSERQIHRIERGEINTGIIIIHKLSIILEVSQEEFLKFS